MFAIYKKELRSYFINPVGYIFVGVFLAFCAVACGKLRYLYVFHTYDILARYPYSSAYYATFRRGEKNENRAADPHVSRNLNGYGAW